MKPLLKNSKGVALTIVIIILVLLTFISAAIMSLGYNRSRIIKMSGSSSAVPYYLARGGMVDAFWRLEHNVGPPNAGPGNVPGYFNAGAATADYNLDVNGDNAPDTHVVITAQDPANGNRRTIRANDIYRSGLNNCCQEFCF